MIIMNALGILAGKVPGLIIIVATFAGQHIRRQSGASEKERIAGDAEIIAEVERDLEHVERSLDEIHIDIVHAVIAIITFRHMIVLGRCSIVLPAQQQPGADIPAMSELVIRCQPDGTAWFIAGHGVDRGEVGREEQTDLQGPIDICAAFSLDRGAHSFCREGPQGRVGD